MSTQTLPFRNRSTAPTVDDRDQHWQALGNCAKEDPEVMFPDPCDDLGIEQAKLVCAGCPVFDRCQSEHANEKYGVWFGTSEEDRQVYKRRRVTRSVPA